MLLGVTSEVYPKSWTLKISGVKSMEEILKKLRYFNKDFPREALIDAVNMKEEITETLLEELDEIIVSPEIATENQDYMLHVYSIYLLAQFREKRAFKRIVDLISFKPDEVESLLGDVITERLSSILYSTFDGNLNLLQAMIENPLLNVYGKLYSDGVVNKEECIGYLRALIYDNYHDVNTDIATDIQGVVIEKHIFEMIDDIQLLYNQNRIDTNMFGKYDDFIDFIYSYEYERNLLAQNIIDEYELEEAEDIVVDKHKPVCIHKDGISVLDDVGGLRGFADLLGTIYEGEDKEDASNARAWARSLGWSATKISNKMMI